MNYFKYSSSIEDDLLKYIKKLKSETLSKKINEITKELAEVRNERIKLWNSLLEDFTNREKDYLKRMGKIDTLKK